MVNPAGWLENGFGVDPRLGDVIERLARDQLGDRFVDLWVAGGDFNRDGMADLLGRDSATHKLYFYKSTGAGRLAAKVQIGNSW